MKLKPLSGKVLIEIIEEEKIKSGIILVASNQKNFKGNVIAVSDSASEIFINDIVLFSKIKGEEIEFEDKKYILIKENDISLKII